MWPLPVASLLAAWACFSLFSFPLHHHHFLSFFPSLAQFNEKVCYLTHCPVLWKYWKLWRKKVLRERPWEPLIFSVLFLSAHSIYHSLACGLGMGLPHPTLLGWVHVHACTHKHTAWFTSHQRLAYILSVFLFCLPSRVWVPEALWSCWYCCAECLSPKTSQSFMITYPVL